MSLFTMREWWATAPGADETFGEGAIAVGNVVPEVQGSLADLPAPEAGSLDDGSAPARDELAQRRRRRSTA